VSAQPTSAGNILASDRVYSALRGSIEVMTGATMRGAVEAGVGVGSDEGVGVLTDCLPALNVTMTRLPRRVAPTISESTARRQLATDGTMETV
jgi:hypothetical protein